MQLSRDYMSANSLARIKKPRQHIPILLHPNLVCLSDYRALLEFVLIHHSLSNVI